MKERLKEYLLEKGFNAKSFALKIGVQPSSISHILTGRNKPSVELLEKFLKVFPDADVKYLITGIRSENIVPETSVMASGNPDNREGSEKESAIPIMESNTDVTSKVKGEKIIVLYNNGTFSEFFPR